MRGIVKKLVGATVWRIVWEFIKDHPLWTMLGAAVSGLASYLLGLDWEVWFFGSTIIFCLFMLIRQTWFPHGFRNKKPQPAQPPAQEESKLQRQMLSFILSLIGERPVTTTEIYCREPFVEICPSALHQAFIHLQTNGYIIAEEDPGNNPMAARSIRMFTVTAVTDKGRKP